MGWLRNKVFAVATRALTKPRGNYTLLLPNDFDALLGVIRPGDVILVDGDQRVSQVIKYLTQSTWSHSVLYVGDDLLRRFPAEREALIAKHGRDAEHMMIEALLEGVLASPLSKYASFNLRICRPIGLQREDLQRILDEVIAQIGLRYDVKNLLDLARYFFPVSLIPRRFRRRALQFGSGLTTQVICSSIIGRAFQNVGFPILPATTPATACSGARPRRTRPSSGASCPRSSRHATSTSRPTSRSSSSIRSRRRTSTIVASGGRTARHGPRAARGPAPERPLMASRPHRRPA